MDVSQNRGNTPKMDGENNEKPYEQMDDLGVPLFLETPIYLVLVPFFFFQMDDSMTSPPKFSQHSKEEMKK